MVLKRGGGRGDKMLSRGEGLSGFYMKFEVADMLI